MKKILSLVLVLALAVTLPACATGNDPEQGASSAPSNIVSDFSPESDTEYEASVYVQYVGSDGFAGSGTFVDRVFVAYPDADQLFHREETVLIKYYGRDYKAEDKTVTINLGYDHTLDLDCKQVITKVTEATVTHAPTPEPDMMYYKPIIYLYPEEDTVCSVRVDLDGRLTCTYPEHGTDGWRGFTAKPDGTLVFPDGSEYYALYWEGVGGTEYDFSRGFCVKGSDTAAFLADILPRLGLSAREANEFIVYWLPRMQDNAYNLIAFQSEAYTDSARLMIDPAPDTLIRVFMAYKPIDAAVEIAPQEIATPARDGFTVVEWGGSEVK